MRNTRLYTAGGIVILLLVVFLIQLGCGGDKAPVKKVDETPKDTAGETVAPDDTTEAPETVTAVYFCPMHPEQTSTNPDDTCPICGMALELKADAAEETEDDEGMEGDGETDPHAGHEHGE